MHAIQVIDKGFHGLVDLVFVSAIDRGGHLLVKEGEGLPAEHVVLGTLQDDGGQRCG